MTQTTSEYRRSEQRCEGKASVGAIVGYSDCMNNWEPCEVMGEKNGQYVLRNLDSGATRYSDLRQYGWTFARQS